MDAKLAAAYGTAPVNETDLEALATAELATKLAASDELDVTGLSDDEAEALAASVLGDGETQEEEAPVEEAVQEEEQTVAEGEEATAEEPAAEDQVKVAQEKIAEADYLGRVMAHAYVAERTSIEKEAAAAAEKTAGAKMDAAKKAGGKVAAHLKANKKGVAAVGAAGAGGFMAGRMSKKDKKASAEETPAEEQVSALDQLAQMRAMEILKENGIDPAAPVEETEKKSSISDEQQTLLNAKVDERAHQLLIDNGYTFKDEATTDSK